MKIEIIAIGSEILSGFTINSNAAYISRELLKMGLQTTRHTVLPDNGEILNRVFTKALERNDLVIATGGLGPTCDDITLESIAEVLESGKTTNLPNQLGSAEGILFEKEETKLFLLPGVPPEMVAMLHEAVLPVVRKSAEVIDIASEWIHFAGLVEKQVDPYLREYQEKYPSLDFGIYPARGKISVHVSAVASESTSVSSVIEGLRITFPKNEYSSASGNIEEAIHGLFIQKGITLSLAESCTGGSIAARLTGLAGASEYFQGSLVTYSNAMKTNLLGVPESVLVENGAVSQEVVETMVNGLLERTETDYGIAVSGIAGPGGGTSEKPVGTVWAAIQRRGEEVVSWKMHCSGSREMIIDYTVNAVLGKLYHRLLS